MCLFVGVTDILVTTPNRLVHMLVQEPPAIQLHKYVTLTSFASGCVSVWVRGCEKINEFYSFSSSFLHVL